MLHGRARVGRLVSLLFGPLPDGLCPSQRSARAREAPPRATATGPGGQPIRCGGRAGARANPTPLPSGAAVTLQTLGER